jgi:hypothetical protein
MNKKVIVSNRYPLNSQITIFTFMSTRAAVDDLIHGQINKTVAYLCRSKVFMYFQKMNHLKRIKSKIAIHVRK